MDQPHSPLSAQPENEEEFEIPEGVKKLLKQVEEEETIQLKEAEVRNIIFVGRSRAGKSTALQVLKNPTEHIPPGSIFSQTTNPSLHSFTVEAETEKGPINYTVNLFDTPGLFEIRPISEEVRTDEVIKNTIAKCMEYEITKIHAIFFVCSFSSGVNEQDVLAFEQFMEFFSGATDQVAMLVTRTERLRPGDKERLITEVQQHSKLKALTDMIGRRIFFIGALDEEVVMGDGVGTLKRYCNNVVEMRKMLYEWVFSLKDHCRISGLNYCKVQKSKADILLEKLLAVMDKGLTTDQTEERKELRESYEKLMAELKPVAKYGDSGMVARMSRAKKALGWE